MPFPVSLLIPIPALSRTFLLPAANSISLRFIPPVLHVYRETANSQH